MDYAADLGHRFPKKLLEPQVVELLSKETEYPIGIACSGGLDSLCLLLLSYFHFPENKWIVLHFNHNLRDGESDEDEMFVHKVAAALGLVCFSAKRPPSLHCSEADLRKDRYAFFENILLKEGGCYLLLGHHWDDVCESWIMRMARGASLEALISPLAVQSLGSYRRLRPLIHLERRQLEEAMRSLRIPWREDSSNHGDAYLRNRIRHGLIPEVERLFPKKSWRMGWKRVGQQIREAHEAVALYANPFADLVNDESPDFGALKGQARAIYRHILDAWLQRRHLREHICWISFEKLLGALLEGHDFSCSIGIRMLLRSRAHHLILVKISEGSTSCGPILWDTACVETPSGILEKTLCQWRGGGKQIFQKNIMKVWTGLPENQVFRIRNWQAGDVYRPFGFFGRKKLKKMFQEHRVSLDERQSVPVITLFPSGEIVWVPYLPICDDFRVLNGSTSALELTFRKI
ncbi:MAG: tRNA lysidine(34) synthetase TilS [Puniceicoccales bacterium]|jgi:tRNA(Ile)-lysidine synthase|nr:tRNA lysidine(34) synthetase TilS [Puniceicoccales bacterium]